MLIRIILGEKKFSKLYLDGPLTRFYKYVHDGIHLHGWILYVAKPNLKFFSPDATGVYNEIFVDNVYERFFKPTKGSTIIDVGAHIGFFAIKASRFVGKKGLVVALEPHPINYRLLTYNIKLNKATNVVPFKVAAGSYSGIAKMYISSNPLSIQFIQIIFFPTCNKSLLEMR